MISVHFQGKSFNITVIQVYAPTTNAEENEVEWFCEDLQDLIEPTQNKAKQNKKTFFHHRGLECKSRKSRDTWRKRQVWPWSTKWSRAKANRALPREQICHRKHPLPTQEMTLHMDITRWLILKSYYSLCSWRWRSSMQSAKTRPGADCGSNHQLFIAKFRLKLKKLGKLGYYWAFLVVRW